MTDPLGDFHIRRTFAIISHPDAGKTTLTEKLLLYGGAIQMAGEVKARKAGRHATSDWMAVERERGISVTASVMTFAYGDCVVNLLDTPGHKDFSEDTYRTLTAVDSAVMVLDAAKGIESQTLKLFEVCRLRDTPVITFVNKMDREGQDPFALLDEVAEKLALDVAPITWPVGMGDRFKGYYHLGRKTLHLFLPGQEGKQPPALQLSGIDDPQLEQYVDAVTLATFREQVEMAEALCPVFDEQAYQEGHMTPVFFGSAINSFGVEELLRGLCTHAPCPRPQRTAERLIEPGEPKFSGFVFKIQANMDKNHRDRIAFVRICSGKYSRGMKVLHGRSGKTLTLNNPVLFLARDRELAEEALPGDIIGIPNHGNLQIGDALTEGESLHFTDIPNFAPEIFRRPLLADPMRQKHLKKALQELSEEGVSQLFKPLSGGQWIVGVVGALQLEVMQRRLQDEYQLAIRFEDVPFNGARWVLSDDKEELERFRDRHLMNLAEDGAGMLAYMAPNEWHIQRIAEEWPKLAFKTTRENHA